MSCAVDELGKTWLWCCVMVVDKIRVLILRGEVLQKKGGFLTRRVSFV